MARPRRSQRLRTRRSELPETPHRGPSGDEHLRRHARRLVGSLCSGPKPSNRLRLARFGVHPRGSRRLITHRLSLSTADHLEQGTRRSYANTLLVRARAVLVCAKEKRALVWESRRELDDLGLAIAEVHHGWI